ncbi:hypothetical protein [Shewanella benthica]|uniref:Uncharacterized protein n=1 Tax=Shewanella benthica KT99 TaxID=314608 RepID=A9D838_9GAMM|nr:hypothetical protein [Shewanella benthica]EDQ00928.1 hypothetical protein KT99_06839 [Shewanella benthica KT99]
MDKTVTSYGFEHAKPNYEKNANVGIMVYDIIIDICSVSSSSW